MVILMSEWINMMRTVMQAELGHGDPWDGEMANFVRVK